MSLHPVMRQLRFSIWLVAFAVFAARADAATNIVSTLADNGPGSLRAAIVNALSGDTIIFSVTGTVALTSDELVIRTNLTIVGSGSSNIAVSGGGLSRVFTISTGVTAQISKITIRDGRTRDGLPTRFGEPGGGFHNSGRLILNDCVITANRTGDGGNGTNVVDPGYGPAGGDGGSGAGIYNTGTLLVTNCSLSGNRTGNGGNGGNTAGWPPPGWPNPQCYPGGVGGDGGRGGAVYNAGVLALAVMDSCVFRGNSTGNGGNAGFSISCGGNSYRGDGGSGVGVWNYYGATANTIRCLFTANFCGTNGQIGGPKSGTYGGIIANQDGRMEILFSTIASNSPGPQAAASIRHDAYGRFVLISNCTVSGNLGSAIHTYDSSLTLATSTVVSNTGYGIYKQYGQPVLHNSLVAGNQADDLHGDFLSLGHNFIGRAQTGGFTNSGPGDVINGGDPFLAPLADNGGSTPTHALLPGSPAIDAGDDLLTGTDQRGRPRLSGAHVDIGAFEFQVPTPQSLTAPRRTTNGGFQFTFTNLSDATPSVLATTNVSLASTQWQNLGPATLTTNGVYQFTDPGITNNRQRFFQLRWP